jgi:hypothetical protein
MKKILVILVLILILSVSIFAIGKGICPIDNLQGSWTGQTQQTANGPQQIWKCPNGHTYLIK